MPAKRQLMTLGLIGLLSSTTLYAQQQLDPVEYGARIGLNISYLYNGDVDELYNAKAGMAIGGLVKFRLSRWLAVQPELLYSQQGAVDNGLQAVSSSASPNAKVKMDYLIIPVVLKVYPSRRFNLQAGPQLGFLLSSSVDGENANGYFTSGELALTFGLGYEFNKGLLVDIRINAGLTNVNDISTLSPLTGAPEIVGNVMYLLSAGWRF